MAIKDFILLGLSGNSDSLEYFILTGLESPLVFIPPYIEIMVPPDDLSLNVPAEQTEYATVYRTANLTDHSGNKLTDHNGNYLVVTSQSIETVYTIHVPPDDLSVNVMEET